MKINNTNKKVITYTIKRKKDINSMYISIQNGEIEVTAPKHFTNNEIQKIIEEKREWILEKVEQYNFNTKKENNGIERNPVKVFGKDYKMKIQYKNIKVTEVDVEKDNIKMILPIKYKKRDNKKILDLAINKMYESIAIKEIEIVMEKTRIMLGYAPEDYKIEKLKNGLGKCVKGVIIINPEIVKYNRKFIEKVVVEQFLKLKYKVDSKKYEEELKKYETVSKIQKKAA